MSTSGDVESPSSSLPASAAGSPRSKVKFLCSHGGKILPRPVDGHLKYVGGETRVISVSRSVTFTDLMKKLSSLIEGDVTLKYQLIPDELDALVTVKSDEDLRHMMEEYDRQELTGTPRLRTFLFPTNPIVIDNPIGPMDRQSLEQRYINSINGIVFNPTVPVFRPPAINTNQTSFTISSACSSPRTPPETTTVVPTMGTTVVPVSDHITNPETTGFRKVNTMTRARSSPNLCNLGAPAPGPAPQPTHKNLAQFSTLYYRQPPPPPLPPPHHLHPHAHHHPQLYPKPPLDPSPHKTTTSGSITPDHLMRMRSTAGLGDYYSHSPHTPNPYSRSSRGVGGHMVYQRSVPYDEYYGNNRYDRESPPGSPLSRSAIQSNYITKWDSIGAGR